MNRKISILLGIIILIFIIFLMINKNKIRKKTEENLSQNSVKTMYNEDEEKYVVYDETGTEIYNGINRAEAEFRERHPDFKPGFEEMNKNIVPIEIIGN